MSEEERSYATYLLLAVELGSLLGLGYLLTKIVRPAPAQGYKAPANLTPGTNPGTIIPQPPNAPPPGAGSTSKGVQAVFSSCLGNYAYGPFKSQSDAQGFVNGQPFPQGLNILPCGGQFWVVNA